MTIALEQRTEGIVLPVKAHAGARKTGIAGVHTGQLILSVTQVPERGKAKGTVIDALCQGLDLRPQQLTAC